MQLNQQARLHLEECLPECAWWASNQSLNPLWVAPNGLDSDEASAQLIVQDAKWDQAISYCILLRK